MLARILPAMRTPSRHRLLHCSALRRLDTERPSPPAVSPLTASSSLRPSGATPKHRITTIDQLLRERPSFGQNQMVEVSAEIRKTLEGISSSFRAPIRFAFAYGSGVFAQQGYTPEDTPLLDFIFAVSHPSHWHAINMQQNPHHYSLPMRMLGSDSVAWMQENGLGAGVWFNIGVEVNGKKLKYGVISIDTLCRDLLDWETLYISGRTHKPVRILVDDARVRLANQVNLASAFRTSLLLLPEEFTELQLYETIAGLSYHGDFRMKVGENPFKVRNIVATQLDAFRKLYGGLIKSFWRSVYVVGGKAAEDSSVVRTLRQDRSVRQRGLTASKLPVGARGKVLAYYERKWNLRNALEGVPAHEAEAESTALWEKIVQDDEFVLMLQKSLGQIVARPTFNQSLKGILSAGPLRSLAYIGPKLQKKWRSK